MLATSSNLTYKLQSRTVYSAPARLLTNNVGKYAMATKHFRCDYSQFQSEPFENAVCIPLTKGKHVLIDAEDYDRISQFLWNTNWIDRRGTGYARCHIGRMHRIIMNTPKGLDVDHQNGNGLDNRKANLRNCTRAQNCWNVPRRKANKSPYRGVDPYYSRWQTSIYINNKKHYLGTFDTAIEAAMAYDKAAIEMRGDFALLNLPATVDEIVGK